MNALFKEHLKNFMEIVFYSILMAPIVAGIAWLVGHWFHLKVSFWEVFWIACILFPVANIADKIFALFSAWMALRQAVDRFGVSKKDAIDGLFIYGLHHSSLYDEWTTDDFKQSLATARAVVAMLHEH